MKKIIFLLSFIFMILDASLYWANAQNNIQNNIQNPNDNKIRIAVIDTGYFSETNYDNILIKNFDSREGKKFKEYKPTRNGFTSLHGTWVTNALINNNDIPLEIYNYRSEDSCTVINCEIKVDTIVKAAIHAARNKADIIQISSYGSFGSSGEYILTQIANSGVHIVISAGNEGGKSELLTLGRRNKSHIHIIGSLTKENGRKSAFTAGENKKEKLLKWRRGEKVITFNQFGHKIKVDGTSFSASIYSADLAKKLYLDKLKKPKIVETKLNNNIVQRNVKTNKKTLKSRAIRPSN